MKRQTSLQLEKLIRSGCGEIQALVLRYASVPVAAGLTCSTSLNHQAGLSSNPTLLEELHHLGVCESLDWLLVYLNNKVALAHTRAALRLQHLFDTLPRGAVGYSEAKTFYTLHHGQGQKFPLGGSRRCHGDAVGGCGDSGRGK